MYVPGATAPAQGNNSPTTTTVSRFPFGHSFGSFELRQNYGALWTALITHAEALRVTPDETHLAGLRLGWGDCAEAVIDGILSDVAGTVDRALARR